MSGKNIIRVSEFEKLYYDDEKPFKQKHWEALCRYRDKQLQGDETYYRILNKGIQFTNYVGVIQAGNLTIEILPKTDRQKTTAANTTVDELQQEDKQTFDNKQSWHNVLLQMLRECRLLQVKDVDYASLNFKSNSILEIYLALFINEAEKLLHEGLLKKYKKQEGNQTALKGQLAFSKHISVNITHQERFYVRYTEYNRNNIFNQILYKALCIIPYISNNLYLTDRVNNLKTDFPEMSDCFVTTNTFERLHYDRKTERYKEAMLISKMLLLNYRPDIKGGAENVIAILFDMNKLWEEFVYRRLMQSATANIKILRQQKKNFWWNATTNSYKTVKPDVVIIKNDRKIILDTKWKIVADNNPADDDLKQMFVYNLLWNAQNSILLYPGNFTDCAGSYLHFHLSQPLQKNEDKGFYNHCTLTFINVLDEKGKLVLTAPFIELLNTF